MLLRTCCHWLPNSLSIFYEQFSSFYFCSYKFKLEDAAEVKPYIPLLNNRIYDTKFESQFYMISDANKVLLKLPLNRMGSTSIDKLVILIGIVN